MDIRLKLITILGIISVILLGIAWFLTNKISPTQNVDAYYTSMVPSSLA